MRMRTLLSDESGVMIVTFTLMIPVLLIFGVLAVDTGNWFAHQRHLQTQADAAALAAAGSYSFPTCSDSAIRNTALRYSGIGDGTTKYNDKYPAVPSPRLHAVINGPNFSGQTTPGDADLAANPGPCASSMVDVKMTESDLPWFFGTGILSHLNARARVSLLRLNTFKKTLPLAVMEAAPRHVRAFIVNLDNANNLVTGTAPLATVDLTKRTASGGLQRFDNEAAPLSFTPPAGVTNLGVRLALSGQSATECENNLVACYDTSTSKSALTYIREWTDTDPAANAAPVARGVRFKAATCNPAFRSDTGTCTATLEAPVKFNPAVTAPATQTTVKATLGGTSYTLVYSAASQSYSVANVAIPKGSIGMSPVALQWTQTVGKVGNTDCTTKNKPCTGSIADVQQTYWNDPSAQTSAGGPIASFDVLNGFAGPQVHDLQACTTTHPTCKVSLIFEVGIKGSLELAKPTDPPISLRVSGNGSQNQTVDCDANKGFVDEVAYGCSTDYQPNDGTPCSTPTTPLSCVPVKTGTAANKPAQGLNMRVLCEPVPGNCKGSTGNYDGKPKSCPAAGLAGHNNWPSPIDNDPRLLPVFEVPFGSFTGSGNQLVPIVGAATFYITGWTANGNGFNNPCESAGDEFVPGTQNDNGAVSGRFVQHVYLDSEPSNDPCDLTSVNPCAAVLVK